MLTKAHDDLASFSASFFCLTVGSAVPVLFFSSDPLLDVTSVTPFEGIFFQCSIPMTTGLELWWLPLLSHNLQAPSDQSYILLPGLKQKYLCPQLYTVPLACFLSLDLLVS